MVSPLKKVLYLLDKVPLNDDKINLLRPLTRTGFIFFFFFQVFKLVNIPWVDSSMGWYMKT